MPETGKGNCYCGLRESGREVLEQQGIPEGFCGFCDICKKPGHTRHFPGASPVTGSWCDYHYKMVSLLHPMGFYGKYVWIGAALAIIVLWTLLPRWLQ